MRFIFRNNSGTLITITARNESIARQHAMQQLWGDIPLEWGTHWTGKGLSLIEAETGR
jgi:hypothetical protein